MSQPAGRLVADLVVNRLRAWGVPRVFGYSGDGINGLMGALRRAGGDPAFVVRPAPDAAVRGSGAPLLHAGLDGLWSALRSGREAGGTG